MAGDLDLNIALFSKIELKSDPPPPLLDCTMHIIVVLRRVRSNPLIIV